MSTIPNVNYKLRDVDRAPGSRRLAFHHGIGKAAPTATWSRSRSLSVSARISDKHAGFRKQGTDSGDHDNRLSRPLTVWQLEVGDQGLRSLEPLVQVATTWPLCDTHHGPEVLEAHAVETEVHNKPVLQAATVKPLKLIPKVPNDTNTEDRTRLPWWRLSTVDIEMLMQVTTCAAAAIAEPLLGMVDTICIGQLGLLPLAAMAPNNTVFGMINQLATFTLVVTVANKVASALGAGSKAESIGLLPAHMALNSALACSLLLSVVITSIFFAVPEAALNLFGAYPETLGMAKNYFLVRAAGVPAALVTMILQGAYSAALDLKTPLLAIVTCGLLNGIMDWVFIFGFGWGLAGAALATTLAQYAACGLLMYRAFAVDREKFQLPPLKSGEKWWREGIQLRQPMHAYKDFGDMCMVQMTRAVNVIIAWTFCNMAANRLGTLRAASHQLVFQFQMFQVLAMQSFATVGNSVTARAFHGGGVKAARRVADRLQVFAAIASCTFAACTWKFRLVLPMLFTGDTMVHAACQPAMFPVCLMIALTWFKVPEGALLGVGEGQYLAFCYVPAALLTVAQLVNSSVNNLGLSGVWFALVAYYSCLAVLFCIKWYGSRLMPDRKEGQIHLAKA